MNIAAQVIAFVPNAMWMLGTKWAGDKKLRGWALLFFSEVAWVVLAVYTSLWSILPWCALGFVMYGRNYLKWRHASSTERLHGDR